MVIRRIGVLAALLFLLGIPAEGRAFMKEGCGAGECRDCHKLTREEAAGLLAGAVDNVLRVEESPVKGLWLLSVEKGGQRAPLYLDFSKKFIFSGQVFQIDTQSNITGQIKPNLTRTDAAAIPLADAVVMGNPKAKKRIIVFSDPDCHFCGKLHEEIKAVLKKDPDVVFFVKLIALSRNPETVRKATSIICAKSPDLLNDAYAKKALPPPVCTTTAVEDNGRLAVSLTLMGTPAMILPDGRILRGYRDAATILSELRSSAPPAKGK